MPFFQLDATFVARLTQHLQKLYPDEQITQAAVQGLVTNAILLSQFRTNIDLFKPTKSKEARLKS